MTKKINYLTLEDCISLSNAGYDININDGLPYIDCSKEENSGDNTYSIE